MRHLDFAWQTPDHLRLSGQSWQPEGDPRAVVCLVHGLLEHSGRYQHVAEFLTAHGYALVAFDLRGHGKSEGQRGHSPFWDAFLSDVGRLLDEARLRFPNLPVFLYGHSFGGVIVLSYALRRRPSLAGVVATGPGLRLAITPPAWQRVVIGSLSRVWPTFSLVPALDQGDLSRDPGVARAWMADPFVGNRVSLGLYRDWMAEAAWVLEHAAEFPLPLLLMHGTADKRVAFEASQEFASRVPGSCTLKLWPRLYHEIHNEPEQREVLAEMTAWLDARVEALTVSPSSS